MRLRLTLVVLSLLLGASSSEAQPERLVDAVRDLARLASVDIQQRPPVTPVIDRMASALAEWDRNIDALATRNDAELRGASDQRAFQMRVELGLALRRRGRFVDAVNQFDAAAALVPHGSDIHVLRALTLEAAGDQDNAAPAFHTAWSLDPQNPIKAYYVLHHRAGTDLDRARRALTAAYERSLQGGLKASAFVTLDIVGDTWSRTPIVGDAVLAPGFELLAAGRFSEAVAAFRQSNASASGDSPVAHFTRARSDETENRIAEARHEYDAALRGTLVGRHLLYLGMGRLAQVEGDYAAAIDLLVRAVRLNPNDPLVHRELASAFAADARFDDAFTELVASLLIDPADASTMAAIGQLFLDSGRDADAIAALTRTLQLAPDRFETHYALGAAMTHAGKTADAAREFDLFERARLQMVEKRRKDIDSGGPR
jgi:tetratricopeptide (TPR) repeat protein